jgi:predicted transcriptional regulator
MNPADDIRDKMLRFLYERHKTAKGITKIPIGIRDLQAEMKKQYELKQPEVSSNLDYLIQVGWVKEVVKERSFKTPRGMEISQEQTKYKISDVG